MTERLDCTADGILRRGDDRAQSVIVRWMMLEADSSAVAALRPLLDISERSRADRFRVSADRDAYIAAHALLRATLSSVANIAPADWRFLTAETGQPFIETTQVPSNLHFSLSHTRGLAACAIGKPYPIGIDAEAWKLPAPIDLAARYFAPAEVRLLVETDPDAQASTFYRLWTLKEAYLKAIGQGLSVPLDSFAFSLQPIEITFATSAPAAAWQFAEFQPGPKHSLALAVGAPQPITIDAAALSAQDLLRSKHQP